MSGPTSTPSSVPSPTVRAPMRSANRRENSSATDSCTRNRLAEVQASPMLRILASIAPSTASSRSASSKTRNGALPPSSIDTRSSWSEAWATSFLPTAGGPGEGELAQPRVVDDRLADAAGVGRGDDVEHAGRQADLLEQRGQGEHGEGGLGGGLDHHRAAGGDRGPDLAGAHREREVPGRDHQRRADGLLHGDAAGCCRRARGSSARGSGRPPRRTTGRTRRRRSPRPSPRPASCPSPGSSAGRSRRPAR